jgi:hypothetical protein
MPAFETDQIVFIPEEYTNYSDEIRTDISNITANIHNSKLYQLINFISLFLLGVHSVSSNFLPQISLHTELAMISGINMFLCIMFYTERGFTINTIKRLVAESYSKTFFSKTVITISSILLIYSITLFMLSFQVQYLSSIVIYTSSLVGFILHLSLQDIYSQTTDSISKLLGKQDINTLKTEHILSQNGNVYKIEDYEFRENGILDKLVIIAE